MRYSSGIEIPEIDLAHLNSEFEKDVLLGLSAKRKWLSSKYFYDAAGDLIFQEIMKMPSYYLTDCELEIFQKYQEDITASFLQNSDHTRIIELGAGDGLKTKVLLNHMVRNDFNFTYSPVDISESVLKTLEHDLKSQLPEMSLEPLHGDYFHVLSDILHKEENRIALMFLGSNIGNFNREGAINFLKRIREGLKIGDLLFIGFDNKKKPDVILDAYNDEQGITARFNYNLLERINRELGGDFDIEKFKHQPTYNPETGECRSYLLSLEDQIVNIKALNTSFKIEKWETIFTEVSKKYSVSEMKECLKIAGFEVDKIFTDDNEYFTDALCVAI